MNDFGKKKEESESKSDDLLQSLFRAAVMSSRQGITPRTDEGPASLSASQQQMWFFHKLVPHAPVYNTFRAFMITGDLNRDIFKASIAEIVKRHDVLRTVVQIVDETPLQVVKQDMGFDYTYRDLSSAGQQDDGSAEARLKRLLIEESRKTFDLEHGPCLRIFLYRLGEHEHCFQLVLHHFYCDGWSLSAFFRELSALYDAFSEAMPSPLEDLPIQYADYAEWQQNWLKGDDMKSSLAYWQNQLREKPGVLNMPADFPRPSEQDFNGGLETVTIEKSMVDRLKEFSQEEGVTLFMSLLAAYQTILYRYSGETDIVTGSPHANRNHPETHDLIGSFVNTLALRTDLSGNPTFRELVTRVKNTTLDAYAHKDIPFQVLVEHIESGRDMGFSPIFQAAFVLQNMPDLVRTFSGLTFEQLSVDNMTAKYDLNLLLREIKGELRGKVEYSSALFKPERIKRFIAHFHVLLEGITADPDRPVSEIPIMSDSEQDDISRWSNPAADYPVDQCIHALFQDRVEGSPEAVAAVYNEEQLTYKELNMKANRLAHYLIGRGAGPEVLIGIYLERSMDMVIAILAVLKAGAAYVPLDPAYPEERISFILKETGALLLTESTMLKSLTAYSGGAICLDRESKLINAEAEHNPDSGVSPPNAAYVIYTSGSTGVPKGVVVEHRQLVRLFDGTDELYRFNSNDVWTLFHSFAFDFSVWELWGALLYGGRLIIVPYEMSRSTEGFYRMLIDHRVTVLNVTPSVFRELIQTDRTLKGDLALRYVIFGGEELKTADLIPWYADHDDTKPLLVNMYGITETTAHVTYRPLSSGDFDPGNWSGIGRPIPDLSLHILDRNMQPVPQGIPGEMYVGGAGVAREYLKRPDLNKEKFIPDRFSDRPGAKLYRTGDLAKYGTDGTVRFLGRIDNQIKLRGYRIELGEIESVLLEHPLINGSIVTLQEEDGGDKLLIAYLQTGETSTDFTKNVTDFMKQKLPDYMVPSSYVPMESFPITPNGKVDMKALSAHKSTVADKRDTGNQSASPLEEKLLGIWREIIKHDNIGCDDDFFELGGHSLLAMRLIAWVRRELNIELSIHDIFEYPTVRGLADVIGKKSTNV